MYLSRGLVSCLATCNIIVRLQASRLLAWWNLEAVYVVSRLLEGVVGSASHSSSVCKLLVYGDSVDCVVVLRYGTLRYTAVVPTLRLPICRVW